MPCTTNWTFLHDKGAICTFNLQVELLRFLAFHLSCYGLNWWLKNAFLMSTGRDSKSLPS